MIVYDFESAKKYFDGRHYKSKDRRTLYSNNRYIAKLTPEFIEKSFICYQDWHDRIEFRILNTNVSVIFNNEEYLLHKGETLGKLGSLLRQAGHYVHRGTDEYRNILQSILDSGKCGPTVGIERFKDFFPEGSYGLYQYSQMYTPLIVWHENGDRTFTLPFSGYAMSSFNTINTYGYNKQHYRQPEYSLATNNAVKLWRQQRKNLLVTKQIAFTNKLRGKCTTCQNQGRVPTYCEIGTINSFSSLPNYKDEFESQIKAQRINKVTGKTEFICWHNRTANHTSLLDQVVCPSCEGQKSNVSRQCLTGYDWSGKPVIIDSDGKVTDTYIPDDCSESFVIRNSARLVSPNSSWGSVYYQMFGFEHPTRKIITTSNE